MLEGGDPSRFLAEIAVFAWALFGFSQFWVWGRETRGLVAEIERLRATPQHGNEA
jgi:hypothetical protein